MRSSRGWLGFALVATLALTFFLGMPDLAHADPLIFPYTAVQLTEQVNRIPNLYGLLNALNVFPSFGSISTLIEVRREGGIINVLPSRDRGGPASVARRKPGDGLYLEIPHFPHNDLITPQDLQNMQILVGTNLQLRTVESEMAQRLLAIRNKHAITREWLRMGALKGLITDGDGNTIYDLFDAFQITKKVIYFDLSNSNADIDESCRLLVQYISENLLGEVMNYVEVLVSPGFFGKFIGHSKVQKFWLNWDAAAKLANVERVSAGGQMGRVFDYQNIRWREYYGSAPMTVAGVQSSVPFISDGYGHARPVGTMSTFRTYDAPANDVRYVNTPGQEVYISPEVLKHGEGVELKSQSNPLAICRRPEILVEVQAGPPV